jgi:hypothetical protein
MGPDAQSIPFESRAMTQAPFVPNGTQSWLTQCSLSATCALGSAQPTGRSPNAICAQGVPSTAARAQAPHVRWDVPDTEA